MGRALVDPKRERFCRAIVFDGKSTRDAYLAAGFSPSGADYRNYNRLLRHPKVSSRIEELKVEKELVERAARVQFWTVLAEFKKVGVERLMDFFEFAPAGELVPRDLRAVPFDSALAFIEGLRDATGMTADYHLPEGDARLKGAGA
jgi:hypothetical protein